MTLNRVHQLVKLLPDEAPFLTHLPNPARRATPDQCMQRNISRKASATIDPAFGWHFVNSFIQGNLPFPNRVQDDALLLTYEHITRGIMPDGPLYWALAMNLPDMRYYNDVCCALLLVENMTHEHISELLNVPVEAIKYFEALFFNIRDRIGERAYLGQIVFPADDYKWVEHNAGYIQTESRRSLLFRAARRGGEDTVLYFCGMQNSKYLGKEPSILIGQQDNEYLSETLQLSTIGGVNHNLPSMNYVRSLSSSSAGSGTQSKLGDSIAGLEAIGASRSTLANIEMISRSENQQRREFVDRYQSKAPSDRKGYQPPPTA